MKWPFTKRIEKREANFTALAMSWRAAQLTGTAGIADLSATVQTCVSLWESGFTTAEVAGTDLLTPQTLALTARSLALTGEALWFVDGGELVAVSDYDVSTANGRPTAYRLTVPDVLGGRSVTALAAEVIHIRAGCDMRTPWRGTAPLQRASLSAGVLDAIERTLSEVYQGAPIGSAIIPQPEDPTDKGRAMGATLRGLRGRVLLVESTNVAAAGAAAPSSDWKPQSLTPDLSGARLQEAYGQARGAILSVFGVLPAMLDKSAQGPLIREGQRQLVNWTLAPLARLVAAEASEKLGVTITIDVAGPLRAFDAGGRSRSLKAVIGALADAKAAGIDPAAAAAFAGVTLD